MLLHLCLVLFTFVRSFFILDNFRPRVEICVLFGKRITFDSLIPGGDRVCVLFISGVVVEGCCVCLLLQQLGFFFSRQRRTPSIYLFEKISVFFRYHIVCDCAVCVCVCLITFSRRLVSFFFNSIESYFE